MKQSGTSTMPSWVAGPALQALAAQGLTCGKQFTSTQLRAWMPELKTNKKYWHATSKLVELGFLTAEMVMDNAKANNLGRYTVTAAGAAAITVAATGKLRKSGPKGPHSVNRSVPAHSYAARLWSLVRARTMVDSISAASTLLDAGEDVSKASKTAQRYLHRWVKAGALAVSKKRTEHNCKVYVLVKDCGPQPPAWTPKSLARAASRTAGKGAAA